MLRALSQAAVEARSTGSFTNATRSSGLEVDVESSEDEAENISCCSFQGFLWANDVILKGLLGADSEVMVDNHDSPIAD